MARYTVAVRPHRVTPFSQNDTNAMWRSRVMVLVTELVRLGFERAFPVWATTPGCRWPHGVHPYQVGEDHRVLHGSGSIAAYFGTGRKEGRCLTWRAITLSKSKRTVTISPTLTVPRTIML